MVEAMSSMNPNAEPFWDKSLPKQCNSTAGDGSLSVSPGVGSCVLFYNHHIDVHKSIGDLNHRSMHAGCPVLRGKKWAMNWWLEARLPQSDPTSNNVDEL